MQDSQSLKPYRTIRQSSETEIVIQKSRFIGRCFPVESESGAAAKLDAIRKQCWDATHNCHAFRIGADGMCVRSSDDGEPSGTAGMPILNVLTQSGLTNLLCVVTRYFGGILLGAGGLVRAYSAAAASAVDAAGVVQMVPATCYAVSLPYPLWATTENLFRKETQIEQTDYTEIVRVSFWIETEKAPAFLKLLCNSTDGKVIPQVTMYALRPQDTQMLKSVGK